MAEEFIGGVSRHLIFWSGWVFTVGGAVASLWVGREFGWIGALLALAGLSGLMVFAYQKHQDHDKAVRAHEAKERQWGLDLQVANRRADEAEGKLRALPAEALVQIQEIIAASAFMQFMDFLIRHAEYVVRMVQFMGSPSHTLNLRTFTRQSGNLYAVARVEASVVPLLKDGDPFVLTHKDARGLVTDSARLAVHQRNEQEGSVWFLVESFLGDEMPHLDALASKKDVAGLTGYSLRPVCTVERYASFDLARVVDLIRTLAEESSQIRGFKR